MPEALIRRVRRRRGRLRRVLLPIAAVLVLGTAVYGLGGTFGGPWLVDRWLSGYESAQTGGLASHGAIRVHPFELAVEIADLAVGSASTVTAVTADRIAVDFSARSLLERRPVVSAALIDRPRITLAAMDSVAAMLRRALDGGLADARLDRLDVQDGSFDAGTNGGQTLEFASFDFSLADFDGSTNASGRFRLEARTPGAANLIAYGTLGSDLETAGGELLLTDGGLGGIAAFLGGPVAAAAPSGRLGLSGEFQASSLLTAPVIELDEAALEIAGLGIEPTAAMTVSSERIDADGRLRIDTGADGPRLSGRITIDDSSLTIRDAAAAPAQTFSLTGAAILMTADAGGDLTLNVGGQLAGAGPLSLTLRMPATGAGTRRVALSAMDLPAPILSVYSAAALGRTITRGTADFETQYTLSGDRVDGKLSLVARGLEFAKPAADAASATAAGPGASAAATAPGPSASAAGSKLELAAALLEDADRVVTLELPFAGNALPTREAAAAALRARLAALTATPFDALAPLIAGEAGADGTLPFQPGDPALNDRALATIGQLVDILRERPRLGLRIHGGYDAKADRDALAREQIQLHVELATAGTQGQASAIDFGSPRAQDVLDEFAGERLPPDRVAELKQRFECEGAMVPLCRRAYYELVFDALVDNEEIAPTALSRLGRFRAASVADALTARGVAPERIEVVTDGEVVDSPFGIGLRVELTAAAPG